MLQTPPLTHVRLQVTDVVVPPVPKVHNENVDLTICQIFID